MSTETIEELVKDCGTCANYYTDHPALDGWESTCDLYLKVKRLSEIVAKQQRLLDHLIPDKSADI